MKLEELQTLLQDMSPTEKLAYIRSIRDDRRISKHAITHKVKRSRDNTDKLADKFAALSLEDQEELRKILEAE